MKRRRANDWNPRGDSGADVATSETTASQLLIEVDVGDKAAAGQRRRKTIVDNPYSRWASLEAEALSSGQYEQSDSSNVIRFRVDDDMDMSSNSNSSLSQTQSVRLGRILTMLSSTLYASDDEVTTTEIAAVMAVRDFNLRRWRGVYDEPTSAIATSDTNDDDAALDDAASAPNATSCNFYLTIGLARPIGNNVQEWARQYLDRVLFYGMLRNGTNSSDLFIVTTIRPMSVLGGTTREAAVMLAQLGSVSSPRGVSSEATVVNPEDLADEGVMVMSPVASTTYLDDIPMFMRTVTTTRPFAQTLCRYLRSIGVKFLGVFYSNDILGTSYLLDLKVAAANNGIEITPISYDATLGQASLDDDVDWSVTISKLENFEILYYFGVLTADSWVQVITRLHRSEMLGANSDRVWFFDRTLLAGLSGLQFHMDNITQSDLVHALNRSAIVDFEASSARNIEIHAESFQQTLSDPDFVEYWEGLRIRGGSDRPVSLDTFTPQPSIYSMLAYDAVMAMGLGACQTADQELIKGGELMNQTTHTRFFGATGDVRFNSFGTREPDGLIFQISNVFFRPADDSADYLEVDHVPCYRFNVYTNESVVLRNLTFPSGSTTPPPVTDATVENTNPVPVGVSVVSFVLAATVILLSLAFATWTTLRRNSPQVRASQPVFLVLVCFGTLMVGVSITLSAVQYIVPTSTCMVYAWLFALGISLVFAALFAKTWRIHRVFKSATRFRRVEIRAKDVLWPIVVICSLEVAVLTAWTVVDPLVYTRYPVEYDRFGNVVQSNGACMSIQTTSPTQYAFFGATMAISVFTLLVSAYQSYRARNLPSQFNESKYIAISNMVLVESLIIGCPVLIIAREDPATFSLALNALVAVMSLAVLLPVFVPKFTSANDLKNRRYVPTASYVSDASAGQAVSSIVHALSRRIGGLRASSRERISTGRFESSNVSQVSNASRPPSDDGVEPETGRFTSSNVSQVSNASRPPSDDGLEPETNKVQERDVEPEPTS